MIQHFLCARVTVTVGTRLFLFKFIQRNNNQASYYAMPQSEYQELGTRSGWVGNRNNTRESAPGDERRKQKKFQTKQRTSARNTKSNRPSTVPPASNASKEASRKMETARTRGVIAELLPVSLSYTVRGRVNRGTMRTAEVDELCVRS